MRDPALSGGGELQLPLYSTRQQRKWPAQGEVDRPDHTEDDQRLEGGVVDDLPGPGDLGEADARGEGRAFEYLHQVANGRGQGDFPSLRQDDEARSRDIIQTQRVGRFPLTFGNSLNTATPDLAEECAGVQNQCD